MSRSLAVRATRLRAAETLIGGNSALGAGNTISGNALAGVQIEAGASRNQIAGNYIGTKVLGVAALENAGAGVLILNASDNTIGGISTGPGSSFDNVISGNSGAGVEIRSTDAPGGGPSSSSGNRVIGKP